MPAFAAEIGEAENTIRKIVYGQRQPSLPLAVKIAAKTDGAVTEADLILSGEADESRAPAPKAAA